MSPRIGTSNLQTINGVIPGLDAGGRMEVSLYGQDAVPGDTPLLASPLYGQLVVTAARSAGVDERPNVGVAGLKTVASNNDLLMNVNHIFNEVSWDRERGNTTETLLASAVRSATTSSATMTNYNARGGYIFFDVTIAPGADTVTLTIEAYDPLGAFWQEMLTGAAEAAACQRLYLLYPDAGAAAGGVDVVTNYPLARVWRVTVTHSAATDFTYTVHGSLIL